MKREMKGLLYAASIALLATACSNNDENLGGVDINKPIDLKLMPAPAATADTKAAIGATSFDANDNVGLFLAWTEGASAQVPIANSIVQNSTWQNGSIIKGEQLYWQNTADEHTIYAYYPHADLSASTYSVPVTIQADQQTAGATGFENADVLYGTFSGQAQNNVSIAMGHTMSQVTVKLEGGNGYTSGAPLPTIAKVELNCPAGFILGGTLALADGKIAPAAATTTATTLTAYNDNDTYRAILVPGQTISQGTEFVCITTDDNTTYTYTLDKAITTESNTIYALTLKLHKGEIELTSTGLTISQWGQTNTIDGDADMDIQ